MNSAFQCPTSATPLCLNASNKKITMKTLPKEWDQSIKSVKCEKVEKVKPTKPKPSPKPQPQPTPVTGGGYGGSYGGSTY